MMNGLIRENSKRFLYTSKLKRFKSFLTFSTFHFPFFNFPLVLIYSQSAFFAKAFLIRGRFSHIFYRLLNFSTPSGRRKYPSASRPKFLLPIRRNASFYSAPICRFCPGTALRCKPVCPILHSVF